MKPTPFNLANGYVHEFIHNEKVVRLCYVDGLYTVTYSVTNFPEPVRQFTQLSDAMNTFYWFSKSLKHGYL